MSNWKPLHEDPGPRPVKHSLDAVAKRLGGNKASTLEAVFERWVEVVGDAVAAHARPISLRRGTLAVAVEDPAWASELKFLGPRILERCAEVAGPDAVRRIEVKVRP